MPCSCRKIVLPRRRAHVGVTKEMGEREAAAVGPRLAGTGPRRGGVQGQFGHIHHSPRRAASQRGYFRPRRFGRYDRRKGMQGVQRIRRWPRGPRPSPRFARSRCLPTAHVEGPLPTGHGPRVCRRPDEGEASGFNAVAAVGGRTDNWDAPSTCAGPRTGRRLSVAVIIYIKFHIYLYAMYINIIYIFSDS
jgi:hypothetical protein